MMSTDELELDTLGGYKKINPKTKEERIIKQKSALFVIISDTDSSFNLLCDRAEAL